MQNGNALAIVEFQRVLDEGFRVCLDTASTMHEQLRSTNNPNSEKLYSDVQELRKFVAPWVNKLYETMARTLFEVLAIMQPEDFESGDVNFYFLPGYHSCLTDRRLFYRSTTLQNVGIGLSGNPRKAPRSVETYHDCCQAQWYTFATTPPEERDFRPGSPYFWYAYQQPTCSENTSDLIASFTFSRVAQDLDIENLPEHKTVLLDVTGSDKWGDQVAELLNGITYKKHPEWVFPDRYDRRKDSRYDAKRERELRRARCLLISLWMHSVFENARPQWWQILMDELQKQSLTSVTASLLAADADPVASNWGDEGSNRAQFTTWTTVSMHRLAAPPPVPLVEARESTDNAFLDSDTYLQTVGWATMLSSVPLRLPFISVVRPWIRMIYGMLRSAEVHVLLKDRLPLHQAEQAVRIMSHDMYKLIEESVKTLITEVEATEKEKVDYRRFVLHLLKAQGELAYAFCNAATDPVKAAALRYEILNSLQVMGDKLITCLHQVATEVQEFRMEDNNSRFVPVLPKEDWLEDMPFETHVSCLFLVGEIIRNHCQHGNGTVANLFFRPEGSCLAIVLEVPYKCKPGHSYGLLKNALETLRLGSAKFNSADDQSRWTITINISEVETS
ncbi:MAG TPA: hypothetical protein VFS90_25245 [Pyrinomonadaceae bacterium]|nr:hypothetical protein [Pyrinomonadaceae bacterium]